MLHCTEQNGALPKEDFNLVLLFNFEICTILNINPSTSLMVGEYAISYCSNTKVLITTYIQQSKTLLYKKYFGIL